MLTTPASPRVGVYDFLGNDQWERVYTCVDEERARRWLMQHGKEQHIYRIMIEPDMDVLVNEGDLEHLSFE